MATTKAQLRERIQRLIQGGMPSNRGRVADAQIDAEVSSYVAKALRLQVFEGFKDGQRVPDGAVLATYENVPIERRDNGRCVVFLPVVPIVLPKSMGVFRVYPAGYPEREYIPLSAGMMFPLRGNKFLSPLGRKTYTYNNRRITINSDIVAEGVTAVDLELCVTDIAACGDNEILPIPPDVEADVVAAVYTLFTGVPLTQRADDKQPAPSKADAR